MFHNELEEYQLPLPDSMLTDLFTIKPLLGDRSLD